MGIEGQWKRRWFDSVRADLWGKGLWGGCTRPSGKEATDIVHQHHIKWDKDEDLHSKTLSTFAFKYNCIPAH